MNNTPSLVGSRLGKYEIKAEIGRGGMGSVYLGYDPLLDRQVAVKVLAPHLVWDHEFVERFLREARAAARLKHPNIVTVFDVGQEGGWYYFVMEHLAGETLAARLQREGALPAREALSILRPLASALDYAHYRGVVHRDVKPGNAILGPEGQVTLLDFGIARAAQEGRLTGTGTVVGTPEYMSPEQARGMTVDARTDQYSLGVVAYQILCGQVPFQADSTLALMYKIVHEPPPPLSQYRPDLPAEVGAALEQALAKEPGARYLSAAAFVEALGHALAGSTVKTEAAAAKGQAVAAPDEGATAVVPDQSATVAAPDEGATVLVPDEGAPAATARLAETWRAVREASRRVPLWAWGVAGGLLLVAVVAGLVVLLAPKSVVSAPDTRLAFVSDRDGHPQIYIMDAKATISRLMRHTADDADPTWSPDKTRLAFASTLDGNWEIYWINADGTGLTRVTDNPAREAEPAWSPEGNYIAFSSDRDGKREVYTTGAGGVTRVTHTPGAGESWEPAWGPDGTLFFTSTRDGKREVYRTTSSGAAGRVTQSPGSSSSWSPAWAGTYMLFVSDRDGWPEVYALMADGEMRRVTYTAGAHGSWDPACSAFGWRVAFTSDRGGRPEIYTIAEDGVLQMTHTAGQAQSWSPAW
jgi:Tol biopolymer transport system component